MTSYNVHDAKTHFSRLLERVGAGETIEICRNGRPVARLVGAPDSTEMARRRRSAFGMWRDIEVPNEAFEPLPADAWGGLLEEGYAVLPDEPDDEPDAADAG